MHRSVVAGDLEELRAALGNPSDFPNTATPLAIGPLLTYAIYHGPLGLVRALLDAGADAAAEAEDGFPPLIALLTTDRPDRIDVLRLLLAAGADPNTHGLNDWTPLHLVVQSDDLAAAEVLVAAGADPRVRTRIDEPTSALDDAQAMAERGRTPTVLPLLRAAAAD